MTEEVMGGYIDAYLEYRENYTLSDWWVVVLPAFLVSLGLNFTAGTPFWLIFTILSYVLVGYHAKLKLQLYKNKKAPSLTECLSDVNYLRDGLSGILAELPYLFSMVLYSIIGYVTMEALVIASPSLLYVYAFIYVIGLIILPYFVLIPFNLVPYILATDDEIDYYDAVKLSYDTLDNDRESKIAIVHAYILATVVVLVSAFLMFIPLIYLLPYIEYYMTDMYVKIMKKNGLIDLEEDVETNHVEGELNADIIVTENPYTQGTVQSTQDEPTQDEPNQDEPTQDESTQDEPNQDEPNQDEPTQDEPTQEESNQDEPNKEDLNIDDLLGEDK